MNNECFALWRQPECKNGRKKNAKKEKMSADDQTQTGQTVWAIDATPTDIPMRILIALPDFGFDATEVAVPYQLWTELKHQACFFNLYLKFY